MNYSFPFIDSCEPYKIILFPGKYRFEAWGAEGGGNPSTSGKGGYTAGNIILKEATQIHIYVGGRGKNGSLSLKGALGGCNGGGNGGSPSSIEYNSGSGGGGATDFRLSTSYKDRILVSGAGGGNCGNGHVYGGYGGGIIAGNSSLDNVSIGASQNFGNIEGIGDNGRDAVQYYSGGAEGNGGSGGGYRGGTTSIITGTNSDVGGSGGSSYVSGHKDCTQYKNYIFSNIVLKNGISDFKSPTGVIEHGHYGDGYARITILSAMKCTCSCRSRNNAITYLAYILVNTC